MTATYGCSEKDLAHYTAYRATGPITIDGRLDEESWKKAPKSPRFVDLVSGKPGLHDTRAAVLWDDEYLYVGFWVEEPDVWGTLTERDSFIWNDNDVEVFIAGKDCYYEFEMNALGTVFEAFYIWKDAYKRGSKWDVPEFDVFTQKTGYVGGYDGRKHPRGDRFGFRDWDFPGMKSAVHIDGTLNKRDDLDRGWTAEIAFPWSGMELLAEGRSLPPKQDDTWRMDFSRFEQIDINGIKANPGWAWNTHGIYDSHIPECFTYIHFSEETVKH